jgi:rhamnulokinase
MSGSSYIACDLGAGSGRVILGSIVDGKLTLDEIHRFTSEPVRMGDSIRWNVIGIFQELKAGLRKVAESGRQVASVSVDSWGVDYALLNARQPLLALPHQYRDPRTDAVYEATVKEAGTKELIFAETGLQFMSINTLYQLIAELEQNPDLLGVADQFLNIGDYVNFLFSGAAKAEQSLASTTQIYNPRTRGWSKELIKAFGLPERIFPEIVPSGTKLGKLLLEIREETNLPEIDVIASCSHDTGAAVAAVPATGDDWAFLSSGTWSLIGVELPSPLINEKVRACNFTNEGGFGGTTRFLKNITGMWLLQELQREWKREGRELDYDELTRQAAKAEPFRSLINPSDDRFAKPGNMAEKIAAFCRETGQPAPETQGQFARCVYESLALLYRSTLDDVEQLTGRTIRKLHIVGGGSKSTLLNQFAGNATGRTVVAGPVEATAAGNVLIQAIALGHVGSLAAAREIVRASFPVQEFKPEQNAEWQRAAERFAQITAQG